MVTVANTCVQCGKQTSNPRFCDRSCAAKFNNRSNPKRKPEGVCGSCGAPVTTDKRLCAVCKDAEAATVNDRAENVMTVRRLDGSVERVKTRPVSVVTRTVVRPVFAEKIAATAPAARVFECVFGFLASAPDWLRQEERARYASLFQEFARFPVSTRGAHIAAETLPAAALPRAAIQWLDELSRDADPLLLSFGLDAVEFFFELVAGRHSYRDGPDLEPIVDLEPQVDRGHFADPRLMRKLYTERVLGGLSVVARVAADGAIRRLRGGDILIDRGQTFGFKIVRCHLSKNPPYEFAQLKVEWPRLQPFDRSSNFSFRSGLVLTRNAEGNLAPWTPGMEPAEENEPLLDVPAHWITGVFDIYDDPRGQSLRPVRSWT